jgi:cytochrome b involved in lipid metabolism
MANENNNTVPPPADAPPPVSSVGSQKKISPEELAKHASTKDCWLLIDGIVYDVTKYLDGHPGGTAVMVEHAGQDCTSNFEDIGKNLPQTVCLKPSAKLRAFS